MLSKNISRALFNIHSFRFRLTIYGILVPKVYTMSAKQNYITYVLLAFSRMVGILCILVVAVLFDARIDARLHTVFAAWSDPTCAPPGCNVTPPVYLQSLTPGTAQTGNMNITGNAVMGVLGVSTLSPAENVEVSNTLNPAATTRLRVTDTVGGHNPELQLQFGAGANHWAMYVDKSDGNKLKFWQGSNWVSLRQGGPGGWGSPAVTIDKNGGGDGVGLDLRSTGQRWEFATIESAGASNGLWVRDDLNGRNVMQLFSSDGSANFSGKVQASGDVCTSLSGGKCLSTVSGGYWTLNGNNIYNNNNSNNGYVGIGISVPTSPLNVNYVDGSTNGTNYATKITNPNAAGGPGLLINAGPNSGGVQNALDVKSWDLSVTRFSVSNNGNVSVGPQNATNVTGRLLFPQGGGQNAIGEYWHTDPAPKWSIGRDLIASGNAGIGFSYGINTYQANGSAVGSAGARQLGLYTSNGASLVQRVLIDGSGVVSVAGGLAVNDNTLYLRASSDAYHHIRYGTVGGVGDALGVIYNGAFVVASGPDGSETARLTVANNGNVNVPGGEVRAKWINSTAAGTNSFAGDMTVSGYIKGGCYYDSLAGSATKSLNSATLTTLCSNQNGVQDGCTLRLELNTNSNIYPSFAHFYAAQSPSKWKTLAFVDGSGSVVQRSGTDSNGNSETVLSVSDGSGASCTVNDGGNSDFDWNLNLTAALKCSLAVCD